MKSNVDALIVISNDKLRDLHGDLKLSDAFSRADNILTTAARGIAGLSPWKVMSTLTLRMSIP